VLHVLKSPLSKAFHEIHSFGTVKAYVNLKRARDNDLFSFYKLKS
jgi:hypothetical protein